MKLFSRITSVFLALMATLFLLFTGSGGYQAISEAKFTLFLLLCGGYVGIMLLLLMESAAVGALSLPAPGELLRRTSWPQRFVLLYLLFTLLSTLFSPHRQSAWLGVSRHEGFVTIALYCLTFLLVSAFGRAERWLLWPVGVGAALFSLLSAVQLMGYNPFTLYPSGYNWFGANIHYSGAYLGTIGNVDLAAAYLCLVIPLFWIGLLRLKGRRRYLLLVPLVLSLGVLVQMSVLAGLVGVFGGGLLALPTVFPGSDRLRRRLALAVGCLLAAAAFLFLADVGDGLFHELHELLHGRVSDSFGSGRIHIWREVLGRIPHRLFFGHGPDTMLMAELTPFTRYDERLGILIQGRIDTAHNEYLNILFHQGVFALAAYLGALVSGAWQWLRRSGTDGVAAMLGGGVLCFAVQAFFGISTCISSPFFWLTFALLDSRCREDSKGGHKHVEKNSLV